MLFACFLCHPLLLGWEGVNSTLLYSDLMYIANWSKWTLVAFLSIVNVALSNVNVALLFGTIPRILCLAPIFLHKGKVSGNSKILDLVNRLYMLSSTQIAN